MILKDLFYALLYPVHLSLPETQTHVYNLVRATKFENRIRFMDGFKTRAIQIEIAPYQYEFAYDMTVLILFVASAEMVMVACDSHSQPQNAKRQFPLRSPMMHASCIAGNISVV